MSRVSTEGEPMSELTRRLVDRADNRDGWHLDPATAGLLREAAEDIRHRDEQFANLSERFVEMGDEIEALRDQIDGLRKALGDVPKPSSNAGTAAPYSKEFWDWYYRSAVPALAPFEDFDEKAEANP